MSEQHDAQPRPQASGKPEPRVGIVLVSHSKEVADSVARLAVGLAAGRDSAPVEGAGGGPDGGLGTSAELISAAAHKVDTGAGVAILVDLGSAVLTVKVLLAEGDELPENSQLVDAPLVEGAIAAVVASAGGADLEEVAAAAEEAYHFRKV
ncbi:dihydroxyacetone kinase, phosphotransfer subunit [Streptomyces sp. WMMB 714]|jgi:PTS hybrid protein|uniref:dihydroxyacetone kinase phosphoryl donor subunit DhaM n=1 Tax=Streptomyces sp. WMMB 714 TaxID=1286822 RepID=UPI0005F87C58|nr:dihydroxyacetone kinase phosphoryl donor subunit DhaM [Streptomyces sp. WMMB 714]SCK42441.1 dihydroxyacetone kinase, phosphotransfer subunit [Streptomyces sp. WMMB 714]